MAKQRTRGNGSGSLFKRSPRGPWYASWYDATGERLERSMKTTDRAAAERILRARLADVALRREGVVSADADRLADAARLPLAEHIDASAAAVAASGATPKHVATIGRHVCTVLLEQLEAERLGEVSAARVQAAVGESVAKGAGAEQCSCPTARLQKFLSVDEARTSNRR